MTVMFERRVSLCVCARCAHTVACDHAFVGKTSRGKRGSLWQWRGRRNLHLYILHQSLSITNQNITNQIFLMLILSISTKLMIISWEDRWVEWNDRISFPLTRRCVVVSLHITETRAHTELNRIQYCKLNDDSCHENLSDHFTMLGPFQFEVHKTNKKFYQILYD